VIQAVQREAEGLDGIPARDVLTLLEPAFQNVGTGPLVADGIGLADDPFQGTFGTARVDPDISNAGHRFVNLRALHSISREGTIAGRRRDENQRMSSRQKNGADILFVALVALVVVATGCGDGRAAGPGGGAGSSGGGTPAVLASGERGAWAIAVDATNVYWTNQEARTVMKVPIAGGTPVTLAMGATATEMPWDLAVDSDAVYWNYYSSPGSVMTTPLAGGTPATVAAQQNGPRNLAVANGNVYWINLWVLGDNSGAVMAAPLTGGPPVTLASAQDDPNGIAVDVDGIFWSNLGGTIMKMSSIGAGGVPVVLASAQPGPQHLAVDGTNVYWTNVGAIDNGSVMKVAEAGGTPVALATGQQGPFGIAVDGTSVYWTDVTRVMKVAIAGGTPVVVASGQQRATDVAVDATSIYWTDTDAGTIMKVAK